MANTRYIAVRPLEPGKPVDVLERDELGALVGAWHGYWNFKRETVALYPNPRNKYVNWPGGRIPEKRIVSDRSIRVQNAEGRMKIQNAELTTPHPSASLPPSPPNKGEGYRQEQIKFN